MRPATRLPIALSTGILLLQSGSCFLAFPQKTRKISRERIFQPLPPQLQGAFQSTALPFEESLPEKKPNVDVMLAGKSPKAVRLRKTVAQVAAQASNSTSPIVLLGPKGGGKPIVINDLLDRLPSAEVHRFSLTDALGFFELFQETLQLLAPQKNATLVLEGYETQTTSSEDEFTKREELDRIVSELLNDQTFQGSPFLPRVLNSIHQQGNKEPAFLKNNKDILLIKVPALQSRVQDMAAIAETEVQLMEKEYGLRNVILTPEAIQRLLDHTWADGEPELQDELRKGLVRLSDDKQRRPYLFQGPLPYLLEPKHLLVDNESSLQDSFRRRLLYDFPIVRQIINSPWVFDHLQRYIVLPVYILFLAVLFEGAQTRDHSAALTVFWAGWWPAVMISFPLLGRIWCSICPFMIVGNLAQDVVKSMGVTLKRKWPKWVEPYGAPFAFGLFFAILVWEELWDLPNNGTLSAWLLLLITSGAVFNSVQFEDRLWCRHLCPIGAMCRTFGTTAMTEVRSFKANCVGCDNPQCVNGESPVPQPTDEFALKGCTMRLKNNQLLDMGHCTVCMSCVKNCEKETPEVNLRPIGVDYGLPWLLPPAFQKATQNLAISQVETNFWMGALLTILQGSVLVHYMPRILYDLGVDPTIVMASPGFTEAFYAHSAATVVILAFPGLLSLWVDQLSVPIENLIASLQREWGEISTEDARDRETIINVYEALLKEDISPVEILKELDPDGDGVISSWEWKHEVQHLQLIPEARYERILELMRQRTRQWPLPANIFLDTLQQLYMEARGNDDGLPEKVQLKTQKTFVELFNDLDKDGDGFIAPDEFDALIDRNFGIKQEEKLELFRSADVIGQGRLNLFEFMTLMRKIVKAGIQEIGYGYLPWGSLTAYWLGLGLKELGLTLARAPDTFYLDRFFSLHLPSIVASDGLVEAMQTALVLGTLTLSIGLTQKLCDDNKISGARFGAHVAVQVVGAWTTLYLMLSSNPLLT